MLKFYFFIFSLLITFLIIGCKENLPLEKTINGQYELINQDSSKIIFPDNFKGKITVIGFIFTHCPDVCPLTTNNMKLVQEELFNEKIPNVEFAALSFDPGRDTPEVLKKYAKVRNINLKNFEFLTGNKNVIDSLLKNMNVIARANDTTYTKSGEPVYYFMHTDRITLIDQNGKIRNEYRGSKVNVENLISDIKSLN